MLFSKSDTSNIYIFSDKIYVQCISEDLLRVYLLESFYGDVHLCENMIRERKSEVTGFVFICLLALKMPYSLLQQPQHLLFSISLAQRCFSSFFLSHTHFIDI